MCDEKLSSDAVPQKFCEWLLAMGCPPETVPPLDKVTQMCRGQYYMVWRSLMEHVHPKDEIRHKRLMVFCDDIKKCKYKNVFTDQNSSVAEPQELSLWRKQSELKEKMTAAEARVLKARDNLDQLIDNISGKLSQRESARRKVEELHRRLFLLRRLAEDLETKKANLLETRNIADSLCCVDEGGDIDSKVNNCLTMLRRVQPLTSAAASDTMMNANPATSCSVVSSNSDNDTEEQLGSLVRCRGDALWPILYDKRNALITALSTYNGNGTKTSVKRETPQSVLSQTAALHCCLALEAMKNRIHIKQVQNRLAGVIPELSKYLSGDSCELLVTRCEESRARARIASLQASVELVTSRDELFQCTTHRLTNQPTKKHIIEVDKAIEAKRNEIKKLVSCLAATERKTQKVKDCLVNVFNGFHKDSPRNAGEIYRGNQNEITQESISLLRTYYEQRREKRTNKVDLSLDMDVSEQSLSSLIDSESTKFVDELHLYLKKFHLEKNRKLVLECGEKVWSFETVRASIDRIHTQWLDHDVACSLLCPAVNLAANVQLVADICKARDTLSILAKKNDSTEKMRSLDTITKDEEEKTIDKIKKRLKENLLNLHKTNKNLEVGKDNLKFWSSNQIKKYISPNRSVDGKTYREFEAFYVENLSMH